MIDINDLITKDGFELTEKFAKGAPCAVDLSPEGIVFRMFWPGYLEIARVRGHKVITVDDVREHWLTSHNSTVIKRFQRGEIGFDFKKAVNCMVRAIKIENQEPACIHGGIVVCPLTEDEYEELTRRNAKLIDDLRKGVR